jgi:superfamily II DNA or RNA helicase
MTPYPDQLKAIEIAVKAHHGGIEMPTGTGKSITMALLINALQVKALVIVPTLELKRQLSESFTRYFGSLNNITIENIDSPRLNQIQDYGVLIVDECHHSSSATYRRLNKTAWKNIYHRYFFSATYFRNNDEEQLLFEGIAGQVIYRLSYAEAVEKKYIVPVEAYTIEVPKQKTDGSTYAQVYSQLVVNNTLRNQQIVNVLTSLHSNHKSTLCLVREIKHGKILSAITGIPFVCGEDDTSRKYIHRFNMGAIKVLIGTQSILGEGIDTKPAEYIIVAGLGKAKSQFMQAIGRGLRTYPGKESAKIILISDKSHKFTSRHFKAQCDIIKEEYNCKPLKLDGI